MSLSLFTLICLSNLFVDNFPTVVKSEEQINYFDSVDYEKLWANDVNTSSSTLLPHDEYIDISNTFPDQQTEKDVEYAIERDKAFQDTNTTKRTKRTNTNMLYIFLFAFLLVLIISLCASAAIISLMIIKLTLEANQIRTNSGSSNHSSDQLSADEESLENESQTIRSSN